MKKLHSLWKTSIVLFLILSTMSFYFCSASFDNRNYDNFIPMNSLTNYYVLNIKSIDPTISSNDFVESFKNCLDQSDLNVYKELITNESNKTVYDRLFFMYANDPEYQSKLILCDEDGFVGLKNFSHYSSHDLSKENCLFTIFDSRIYGIYPLGSESVGFSNIGYYSLYSNNIDSQANQVKQFSILFKKAFGDSVTYDLTTDQVHRDPNLNYGISTQQIILIILFTCLLTIILNGKLFSQQKIISQLKLEGNSAIEIFWKLVIKQYLLALPSIIITYCVLSIIFIGSIGTAYHYFYLNLLRLTILYLIVVLAMSLILFLLIYLVPINLSLKGHSFNLRVKKTFQIIKIVILVLTLPIIVNGVSSIKDMVTLLGNNSALNKLYDNMYKFSGVKTGALTYDPQTNSYSMYFPLETQENIYSKLRSNNSVFNYAIQTSYASDDPITYTVVNIDYLSAYGIDGEIDTNKDALIIPKSLKNTSGIEDDARKVYANFSSSSTAADIDDTPIVYSDKLKNFDYSFITPSRGINPNQIFIYKSSKASSLISSSIYFVYNGDVQQAQDYIDSLWKDYDLSSQYNIISVKNQYHLYYNKLVLNKLPSILSFIIALVTYIILDLQILKIDYVINQKRYFLEYIEGIRFGLFYKDTLLNSLIIIIITILSCYLHPKYNYAKIISIYLILFIFEGLFFIVYHSITNKERKEVSSIWK